MRRGDRRGADGLDGLAEVAGRDREGHWRRVTQRPRAGSFSRALKKSVVHYSLVAVSLFAVTSCYGEALSSSECRIKGLLKIMRLSKGSGLCSLL
jgi:hypothetical protein